MSFQLSTAQKNLLSRDRAFHKFWWGTGFVASLGMSGWYWSSLPTNNYTKFTGSALTAMALGIIFVLAYEGSKLMATKYANSAKSLAMFVLMSIITGIGTQLINEQHNTELKASQSAVFKQGLEGIAAADERIRHFGHAANASIDQLHAEREAWLNQPAMNAAGKNSGMTVAAVLAKGWPAYEHYQTKLSDIDRTIRAKRAYDSAVASKTLNQSQTQTGNATESDEASWLIQVIGAALSVFGIEEKSNVWGAFGLYLFAMIVLEVAGRFNGSKIDDLDAILTGIDRKKLYSMREAATAGQNTPAEDNQPTPVLAPANQTLPTGAMGFAGATDQPAAANWNTSAQWPGAETNWRDRVKNKAEEGMNKVLDKTATGAGMAAAHLHVDEQHQKAVRDNLIDKMIGSQIAAQTPAPEQKPAKTAVKYSPVATNREPKKLAAISRQEAESLLTIVRNEKYTEVFVAIATKATEPKVGKISKTHGIGGPTATNLMVIMAYAGVLSAKNANNQRDLRVKALSAENATKAANAAKRIIEGAANTEQEAA